MVPQRPEMAHRIRRPYQCRQAAARAQPLPLQSLVGMNRWVGFGVIADNLINIGSAMHSNSAR
jgi:hypothetical protein